MSKSIEREKQEVVWANANANGATDRALMGVIASEAGSVFDTLYA